MPLPPFEAITIVRTYIQHSRNAPLLQGKFGGPGECQSGVASMIKRFVANQTSLGKKLLFIAAVGDNFYWNGVNPVRRPFVCAPARTQHFGNAAVGTPARALLTLRLRSHRALPSPTSAPLPLLCARTAVPGSLELICGQLTDLERGARTTKNNNTDNTASALECP